MTDFSCDTTMTSWKMQRLIVGLTQVQLAKEAQLDRRRLSQIERGIEQPTDVEFERLSKVLGYRFTEYKGLPKRLKSSHFR